MKKYLVIFIVFLLIFVAALFLTPSFTQHCTEELFICASQAQNAGFWYKLWLHLGCVYHNVVCVLGGLFI